MIGAMRCHSSTAWFIAKSIYTDLFVRIVGQKTVESYSERHGWYGPPQKYNGEEEYDSLCAPYFLNPGDMIDPGHPSISPILIRTQEVNLRTS